MLRTLTIRNVVLIERLALSFQAGFCALTGETGAGKSILLDSLGLALGGRSESSLIRKGAEQASVAAEFDVSVTHPAQRLLEEQGLTSGGGEVLILRRIVGADGRSRAFINDQPVSIGLLKQAGELLVEIHGQFETQGLLDPKSHRALLDEYTGVDGHALEEFWTAWRKAVAALVSEREKMDKARAEESYLRQSLGDLKDLSPVAGEEEKLASLRTRLMNREQVLEGLNAALEMLNGEGGAESAVSQAWRALDKVLQKAGANAVRAALSALDRAGSELQEAAAQIQALSSDLAESEYSLPEIDDRLFALRGHARKHGRTVEALPALMEELAQRLTLIDRQDDVLAGLEDNVKKARSAYMKAAETAHEKRAAAAQKLDKAVGRELPPLKLDKARFVTQVEKLPHEDSWGPGGMDHVQFMVATNAGAQPGPIHKIASGGEMARFMLALKVVLAGAGGPQTLIFDEVDTGIGGATAAAVGERLAHLAARRQILVVTHAPQVAARASQHLIVLKDMHKGATQTKVVALDDVSGRREEIARMLAGAEITKEARAAAAKLLETGT